MDAGQLVSEFNESLNRLLQLCFDYFSNLSTLEIYGWSALGVGFLMFVIGIFLL